MKARQIAFTRETLDTPRVLRGLRVRRSTAIALIASLLLLLGCVSVRITAHDGNAAARVAQVYFDHLVIGRDFSAAYEMLDPSTKARLSRSAFETATKRSRGFDRVASVVPTGYEVVPDRDEVLIFLEAKGDSEVLYYRLTMFGNAASGYRPAHFEIAAQPFPASPALNRIEH
jgi:hypothetical protein